jgi:hypothetical protein
MAEDADTWKLILKEPRVLHETYNQCRERDLTMNWNMK